MYKHHSYFIISVCCAAVLTCTGCNQAKKEAAFADEQTVAAADNAAANQEATDVIPVVEDATEPINTVVLPVPSFAYSCSDMAVSTPAAAKLHLTQTLKEANEITDDDAWFRDNGLAIDAYDLPNPFVDADNGGNLPAEVPTRWQDLIITGAFVNEGYLFCTYGQDFSEGTILNIYQADTLELLYSLDFSAFSYYGDDTIPEDANYIMEAVRWAEIQDNILYVTTYHNTYAESSAFKNGYITAINLSDLSILWRSNPLVNNASTFVIHDGVIICGYGFTAEDDFLYQIDTHTGVTLEQIKLKSGPSYIFEKDGTLYVRTYNTNYEFTID